MSGYDYRSSNKAASFRAAAAKLIEQNKRALGRYAPPAEQRIPTRDAAPDPVVLARVERARQFALAAEERRTRDAGPLDPSNGSTLFNNLGSTGELFLHRSDGKGGFYAIPAHVGADGRPDIYSIIARDHAAPPRKDTSTMATHDAVRRAHDKAVEAQTHQQLRNLNARNAQFWRDNASVTPGVRVSGDWDNASTPYDRQHPEHNSIPAAVGGSGFSGPSGGEMLRRGSTEMSFSSPQNPIDNIGPGHNPARRGPATGNNASSAGVYRSTGGQAHSAFLASLGDLLAEAGAPAQAFANELAAIPPGEPVRALNTYHKNFHAARDRATQVALDRVYQAFRAHYDDGGNGVLPRQHISDMDRLRSRNAAHSMTPSSGTTQDAPWSGVYEANKSTIGGNPNLIQPGQVLNVGGGQTHTVAKGETLSGISAKYGNPSSIGEGGATYEAPSHSTTPTAGALGAAASQAGGGSSSGGTPSNAPLPPDKPSGLMQNTGSGGVYAPGGQAKGALSAESLSKPVGENATESFLKGQGVQGTASSASSGGTPSDAPTPPSKPAGLAQTQEPGAAASSFVQKQLRSDT